MFLLPVRAAVRRLTFVPRAVELANSIFQLRVAKMYPTPASLAPKAFATLLPAVQILLLRFSNANRSTVGFMVLADAISKPSLVSGAACLLLNPTPSQ